jgi:hypothetical protein
MTNQFKKAVYWRRLREGYNKTEALEYADEAWERKRWTA